jgi:hypothetical protein
MSLAPRDILTTITPLRLVFWGCLLCLIDVHSNWNFDGQVWKIDIVSDVIGALLIVWGAFRLSMLRVSGWYSAAMQRDVTRPRVVLVTHFFNHQTHHRGQAHALLTGFGAKTGDTDLPFIVEPPV